MTNMKCKKCEKKIKPGEKIRLSRVYEGTYWYQDGGVEHIECQKGEQADGACAQESSCKISKQGSQS